MPCILLTFQIIYSTDSPSCFPSFNSADIPTFFFCFVCRRLPSCMSCLALSWSKIFFWPCTLMTSQLVFWPCTLLISQLVLTLYSADFPACLDFVRCWFSNLSWPCTLLTSQLYFLPIYSANFPAHFPAMYSADFSTGFPASYSPDFPTKPSSGEAKPPVPHQKPALSHTISLPATAHNSHRNCKHVQIPGTREVDWKKKTLVFFFQ